MSRTRADTVPNDPAHPDDDFDAFIRQMPKVDLHIHLEGSVRPATLLALAHRNGVALPATDEAGLRAWYRFRDFDHFAAIYDLICDCIYTPDDLALIAYELGASAAADNVRYLEVTMTTNARLRRGLSLDDQLAGVRAGATDALRDFGVRMRFIPDIVPEQSMDEAWTLVRWAVEQQDNDICALGIAGTERKHNFALYAPLFAYARDAGLPRTPHAGETMDAAHVWEAVALLHADRIGHGIRAIEDGKLVDLLAAMQIPLEICPTSNVLLGIYPTMAAHPVRELWDAGVYITVNTDDPPMFGTTLSGEYRVLADVHGFTRTELRTLATNAARAAFLPPTDKAALVAAITGA